MRIVGPTELIWSKAFIQLRHRYDGADVVHVILKQSDQIDWRRLLDYMEVHWEVLLVAPPQLPLDLPDRARPRAALAHGRAARPPEAPARAAAARHEGLPRPHAVARRLCDRRSRSGASPTSVGKGSGAMAEERRRRGG